MTDEQKIHVLKAMTGDGGPEETLSAYLTLAGSKIINRAFPFAREDEVLEVPSKYESLQLEIAAYLLNKRGAEGQVSHSENGINRAYENGDVPPSMLSAVTPYCGIPM